MNVTTTTLGFQKLAGFFYSGLGATYTTTVTAGTGEIKSFNVLKRPLSGSAAGSVGVGGGSGTVVYTEDADVEFELEVWGHVTRVGTFVINSTPTGGRRGSGLASYEASATRIEGLINPKAGGTIRLDQYQKTKSWRDMEALIGAPNHATATAYANGKVVKHSSGELLICTTAGTSGGSEPALTNNGIITDNTATWAIFGRRSKVATGQVVPTITTGAIETKVVDRRATSNPNFYVNNAYLAGGVTPIYEAGNSEKVWRFTDSSGAHKLAGGYETYSDAVVFSIEGNGGNCGFRVYVDVLDGYGYRLLEEDITLFNGWYRIDWKGSRKMRLYKVMHSLNGTAGVGSARISTTSALDTVTIGDLATKKKRRAMFFSDSYGKAKTPDISSTPNYWAEDWHLSTLLGQGLGCDYIYDQSDAGIGYTQLGTTGTIRTHLNLTQVTEVPIDYVIIAAGFNDRSTLTATVSAEALLTWQTARSLYPNAKIIIIAAWNDRSASTYTTANEAAFLSQFNIWGDGNSCLIRPIGGEAVAWVSGTGYVGATTGVGNSDLYISTDSTHPTPIGMLHYVDNIARAARTALGVEN